MTIEQVQSYIDKGFVVFPIEKNKKIGDPTAQPYLTRPPRKWNELHATDMTQDYIKSKFSGADVNLVCVTGRPMGEDGRYLLVFDIDVEGDTHTTSGLNGEEWIQHLFSGYSEVLESTYTQVTPTGGTHYFFTSAQQIKKKELFVYDSELCLQSKDAQKAGIDVLGLNASVTLAGSTVEFSEGVVQEYKGFGDTILQLPEEVEERLLSLEKPQKTSSVKKQHGPQGSIRKHPNPDFLIQCLEDAAKDGVFDQRSEWIKLAGALKDAGFEESTLSRLSWSSSHESWLSKNRDEEIERVWNSVEVDESRATAGSLYYWAKKYGYSHWQKTEETITESAVLVRNYGFYKTLQQNASGEYIEVEEKLPLKSWSDDEAFKEPAKHFFVFQQQGGGNDFFIEKNDYKKFVLNTYQLYNACYFQNIKIDFTGRDSPLTESKLFDYTKRLCDPIDRMTFFPEWKQEEKTLLIGEDITPRYTGALREFVELFTDKDTRSTYRRAAGILSSFLPGEFDGNKPTVFVLANDVGSGKTDSVKKTVQLLENRSLFSFTIKDDRKEEMNSLESFATKFILIDNVKPQDIKGSGDDFISKLEKDITSPTIKAWIFQASHASVRNNKTFWITFNKDTRLTTDMMKRAIIVTMKGEDETSEEEKQDILEKLYYYIEHKRKDVIADALWYLSEGERDPAPTHRFQNHPRFIKWGKVMNNALHKMFPEISHFELGLSDAEKQSDRDAHNFIDLLQALWNYRSNNNKNKRGFIPLSVAMSIARIHSGEWADSNQKTKSYIMNKKRLVKEYFNIEWEGKVKLNGKTHTGFTIHSRVGIPDGPETLASEHDPHMLSLKIDRMLQKRSIDYADFDEYLYDEDIEEEILQDPYGSH